MSVIDDEVHVDCRSRPQAGGTMAASTSPQARQRSLNLRGRVKMTLKMQERGL